MWSLEDINTDGCHVDIEAVLEGKIKESTRALKRMFLTGVERLEIIVLMGIYNVAEGQTKQEILEEINELKEAVKAHSDDCGFTPPSVVSVSTLPLPPKLCSLDLPLSQTEWLPPDGFRNRRALIEDINEEIKAMNLGNEVNYLKLHMEGIRIDAKKGKVMHKHKPLVPTWTEINIFDRIQFSAETKLKILHNAIKIFKAGIKIQRTKD